MVDEGSCGGRVEVAGGREYGDEHRISVFAKLLIDHDPQHQTWTSPGWVNPLNAFEWPNVFREALLELGQP